VGAVLPEPPRLPPLPLVPEVLVPLLGFAVLFPFLGAEEPELLVLLGLSEVVPEPELPPVLPTVPEDLPLVPDFLVLLPELPPALLPFIKASKIAPTTAAPVPLLFTSGCPGVCDFSTI